LFQGELDKIGRGAMRVRECRDGNGCEDDDREYAPGDGKTAWVFRLSNGVLRV
jgi:hypothetical protein